MVEQTIKYAVRWSRLGPIWKIEIDDYSDGYQIGTSRVEALAFTLRGAQRKASRIADDLTHSTPKRGGEIRVP